MGVRAGTQQEHRYQLCRDEYCDRFPCRVYKEGWRDGYDEGRRRGYDEGFTDGYSKGHADGYAQGFGDGQAACPRAHA